MDSRWRGASGWAGSTLLSGSRRTSRRSRSWAETSKRRTSNRFCCWAWAAPACAPKFWPRPSASRPGFPELHIVDSTDPAEVMAACDAVNLAETLVIVASKSGTTLEPNILKQFFFEEMRRAVGDGDVGSHFMAITDPGSKMEQVAKADRFRYIFYGDPADRRALFGALEFRRGSGHCDRPQRGNAAGRGGQGVAARSSRWRTIPACSWDCCWERRPTLGATRSPSSLRPRSTIWARGWSS